jgi:ATP/maltotriose-dependent transcriptional regulator MalT
MRFLILDFRFWIVRQPPDEQQGRLLAYVDRLLSAFGLAPEDNGSGSSQEHPPIQNPKSQTPSGPQILVEPLTVRELEILRLVAAGLSNAAVAAQLIVSVGTVKSHLKHIYSKLAVESRTQAVARARKLGLL